MDGQEIDQKLHQILMTGEWESKTYNDGTYPTKEFELPEEKKGAALNLLGDQRIGATYSGNCIRVAGESILRLEAAQAFFNPNNWEKTGGGMKLTLPQGFSDKHTRYLEERADSWGLDFKSQMQELGEGIASTTKKAAKSVFAGLKTLKKESFSRENLTSGAKGVANSAKQAGQNIADPKFRKEAGDSVGKVIAGQKVYIVSEKGVPALVDRFPWLRKPGHPAPEARSDEPSTLKQG